MSGVALYGFTRHGIVIDAYPVALKSDSDTDFAEIAFVLSLIGVLTVWVIFVISLIEYFKPARGRGRGS